MTRGRHAPPRGRAAQLAALLTAVLTAAVKGEQQRPAQGGKA